MKFLCLCNGGVARSVTLAAILKYWFKHDALAASIEKNAGGTMDMLLEWADVVVVVEPWMVEWLDKEYRGSSRTEGKVRLVDIGPDRWGQSNAPEMIDEFKKHDLPKILGVSTSVWEKRGAHHETWNRRKAGLAAGKDPGDAH